MRSLATTPILIIVLCTCVDARHNGRQFFPRLSTRSSTGSFEKRLQEEGGDPVMSYQSCNASNHPNTTLSDELEPFLYLGMVVTMGVIIIGGIGNSITILTILHQMCLPPKFRHISAINAPTILILNLALCDLLYCLLCLPFVFSIYVVIVNTGDTRAPCEDFVSICKFAAFFRYTNAISEWTTIGLMALERFITISRYSHFRSPTKFFSPIRTVCYCMAIWIIGFLMQLPTLLELDPFFQAFGYNDQTLKCDFIGINSTPNNPFNVRWLFFLLEAVIPCCLILACYAAILFQIYSSGRLAARFGTNQTRIQIAMRMSKTTRVYLTLIGVYLVCVLPMSIWNLVIPEEKMGLCTNQIIGIVLYCIYWLQYGVNSFIYFYSNPKYKLAHKQLLNRILCRKLELSIKNFFEFHKVKCAASVYVLPVECSSTSHSHSCSHNVSVPSSTGHRSADVNLLTVHCHGISVSSCPYAASVREPLDGEGGSSVLKRALPSKLSICSDWSFTEFCDRPAKVQDSILQTLTRKRSASLIYEPNCLHKKLQRQLSY